MANSNSSWDPRWQCALLFALACGGCSAPEVTQPEPPRQDLGAGKRQPDLVATQEPRAPAPAQPPQAAAPSKGEQDLERGIRSYEEGEYKTAAKQLQTALDLGLHAKSDQARAHKYLAFITCASGREKSCREEFGKALDADPNFDLEPAEAGHPVWGAVFRNVKAERAGKPAPK